MTISSVQWCCDTPPRLWRTLHLKIDPTPEYRPRCIAHSFDVKRKSDHHPWWDKTATSKWRALFASPFWSSDGGFAPLGDVVAGDVWWGPAFTIGLQALSPASQHVADSLSIDERIVRSWCNSGSCCHPVPVPQVWCSDVPTLCRCCCTWSATARMISCPSCLPVAASHSTGIAIYCPGHFCSPHTSSYLPKAHSHWWAGTLGIFLLLFFQSQ